ncbi:Hypothetical_protein [Hexamita inflata]|uniref:Hypothetical_protein n=1 Tax=Hexamita inflata TaxID=28002 RepID=A0AA86NGJ9_9EUKA|nr:Hypothetical protein HINF_LOCUS5437 [Hexamita inflata]CAI9918631.1 Hypothetical protein HINF_LOCUS6276 [Hexamita inflata]
MNEIGKDLFDSSDEEESKRIKQFMQQKIAKDNLKKIKEKKQVEQKLYYEEKPIYVQQPKRQTVRIGGNLLITKIIHPKVDSPGPGYYDIVQKPTTVPVVFQRASRPQNFGPNISPGPIYDPQEINRQVEFKYQSPEKQSKSCVPLIQPTEYNYHPQSVERAPMRINQMSRPQKKLQKDERTFDYVYRDMPHLMDQGALGEESRFKDDGDFQWAVKMIVDNNKVSTSKSWQNKSQVK